MYVCVWVWGLHQLSVKIIYEKLFLDSNYILYDLVMLQSYISLMVCLYMEQLLQGGAVRAKLLQGGARCRLRFATSLAGSDFQPAQGLNK